MKRTLLTFLTIFTAFNMSNFAFAHDFAYSYINSKTRAKNILCGQYDDNLLGVPIHIHGCDLNKDSFIDFIEIYSLTNAKSINGGWEIRPSYFPELQGRDENCDGFSLDELSQSL